MSRSIPAILILGFGAVLALCEILVIPPDRSLALSPSEVGKIAKQVTVAIVGTDAEYGSGIIIQHQGNIYTVLTAAHVIKSKQTRYSLTTPDGKIYQLQATTVKTFPNQIDLAVAQFTSDKSYPIAKIGDSNSVVEGNPAFVAGFPAPTASINLPVYLFRIGNVVANSSRPLQGGYGIIYSANTLPGMSGGGVFNDRGELIATHGKGDVSQTYRADTENPSIRFKTGNDLGVPINTLRQFATQLAIDLGTSAPVIAIQPNNTPKADDFIVSAQGKSLQNNYRGAVTDLDRAIAINPRSAEAYTSRSQAYFTLGNTRTAKDDADRAISIQPSAKAYIARALAKIGLSDSAGAKADANLAIQISPDLAVAYSIRGLTKVLSGDYSNVNTDLNRAIALDPNSIETYLLRGEVRRYLGDLNGALTDIDYVIGHKHKLAKAYSVRALIKSEKNDRPGAKVDADRAIEIDPNSAELAYSILGKFACDTGDNVQAIGYADKAIKINAYSARGHNVKGLVYLKLGQPQQAIDNANIVLKLSPQDYDAYTIRGGGYALLKNKAAALSDFRMASKILSARNRARTNDYRTLQQVIQRLEAKRSS